MKKDFLSEMKSYLRDLKFYIKDTFESEFMNSAKQLSEEPLFFFISAEESKSYNEKYSTLIELNLDNKDYGISYSITEEKLGYIVNFYFQDNIKINNVVNSIYFEFPLDSFLIKYEDDNIIIKEFLDNFKKYQDQDFNTTQINKFILDFVLIKNEFSNNIILSCIELESSYDVNNTIKMKAYKVFLAKLKSLLF